METTRAERIRLGLFLLICFAGVLCFIGYIIGEKMREQKVSYFAVFSESVQGLSVDARVMLNGIDVGRVTKAQIDPMNLDKVIVWFEVDPETPIKAGTTVQMTSGISLTGNRYLILSGGDAMDANLPDGSQIRVGKNRINEITGQAENLVERIEILVNNLNEILSADNANKISRTLSNLEAASVSGKKMMDHGSTLVVNSNQMVVGANHLIGDGREFIKTLDAPMRNLDSITQSFREITAELKDAHLAEELKKILAELQDKLAALDTKQMNGDLVKTLQSIESMSKRLDLFLYKNQNSFADGLNQVNEILENLNEFSVKVKNNPSSLIRGGGESGRD